MARVKDLWKDPRRKGKGKRWLSVWIGPDSKEHSKAFTKKVDAERHGPKQEVDVSQGTYVDPKAARTTVEQWCETWLTGYATRKPSTVRQARVHINRIVKEFGGLPLGAVRPSQVKAWCAGMREEGRAPSYVYACHRRLSQIMGDAVHDGLLAKSPCSRRTSPGGGKQRPYVATTEQVWALYDAFPERLRAAVLLGAFVGLRVSEACGLRVGDVDFLRGIVHPAVQYPAEELKTETSKTAIPVPRSLTKELSGHMTAGYSGETLLTHDAGVQLGPWQLERAMREARGKVKGLPAGFRYHDLRHYLASLLIASGSDVKVVQARMRHASAKTTLDTYGHLWPDSDESTRTAIDAVITARTEQDRNREDAR
ncbi:site-specific integrase [Streptomyces sp. T028]|uniref:site-specific integrase n=1 Tax=Streptomyces sp. T028 TaxID=3394379 RepID=UPI003A873522